MSDADPIAEGRAAWSRIRDGRRGFDDWILIARALQIGRSASLKAAATNRAVGSRYNLEMGRWLREAGLDGISNQERYRALQVLENLDAITAWRDALPASTRRALNYPAACFHRWRRETRTAPIRREAVKSAHRGNGKAIHWPGDALRRAAIAIKESRTNDCIVLAKAALQAAIRDETDLLMLLPEKPMLPRSRPMPAVELHAPA
jgi:hypothetical protein